MGWLAKHNADLLERVARRIAVAGHKEAASKIRAIGDVHRSGTVSPLCRTRDGQPCEADCGLKPLTLFPVEGEGLLFAFAVRRPRWSIRRRP
jgi:hypothetical protein